MGFYMEKKLGKEYILIHELGKGGMAEVYLAVKKPRAIQGQPKTSKLLAVKTMIPSFSSSPEFVRMFEEETDIVMNMSHKNIASVIGHNTVEDIIKGEKKQRLILELEFIRGKNLRQILKDLYAAQADLAFEEKLYIVKELAASLDYAHRFVHPKTGEKLYLVHGDISPQNAMVSIEGEVKLIDFGISKRNDPAQMAQMRAKKLQGKFSYMSPEQADGLEINQKTDIFSLGIILWELLSKQRLFYANTQAKILKKVKEAHIPRLKSISPETPYLADIEKIVNKALICDRNLRKMTANDFHQELSSLLNAKYPNFNPIHLGYKIQNFYKKEFDYINKTIKSSLEKLEKKGMEFDERTRTITLINNKNKENTTSSALPASSQLSDFKTTSKAVEQLPIHTITNRASKITSNTITQQRKSPQKYQYTKKTETLFSPKKISSSIFWRLTALLMFSIGVLFTLHLKTKYPETTDKVTKKVSILFQGAKKQITSLLKGKGEETEKNKTLTSKEEKPIQQMSVFVSSHPSRAKILIDGVWDYKRTPKQIRFHRDQVIVLKAKGYQDYILSDKDINKALLEQNQIFVVFRENRKASK